MPNVRSVLVLSGLLSAGLAAFAQDGKAPAVTFNKDVAPIFYQNCVVCHHQNDIAPMSLVTYKEARPWAAAIPLCGVSCRRGTPIRTLANF